MRLINLGHAAFMIEHDGLSIVFDPYKDNSVPGLIFPKDIKSHYVFHSHEHDDHNAVDYVEKLSCDNSLKFIDVILPHDKKKGALRGLNTAKIVYFSDYSILHLGDIGDVDALITNPQLRNIDIVLCPINGFYTISSLDALKAKEKLGWKLLIPMHYHRLSNNSGYPDNGQIAIIRNANINKLEVNETFIDITEDTFKHDVLIFNKSKGDIN